MNKQDLLGLKRICVVVVWAAMSANAFAGILKGTIRDKETQEPLIGATVRILGTSQGTVSNFDGQYVLPVPADTVYDVEVRYVTYDYLVERHLRVSAETVRNFELRQQSLALGEVAVVANFNRAGERALLLEQKKAVLAIQAVGAYEMARKGVSDAQAAVSQVAGISQQEGVKNVFVRGLGDRYNATLLNGFPIPSEDPEYKNIALSIFGTDIIESIGVNKAFGASSPGDVGGASIDINSKELSGSEALAVSAGVGSNTGVFGTAFLSQQGVDYMGFSRSKQPAKGAFDFANGLDPKTVKCPINHNYGISGGKLFHVGKDQNPLSFYALISQASDFAHSTEKVRNATADGSVYQDQTGSKYTQNTHQLLLANVDYTIKAVHNLAYNFMLLHANEEYVGDYRGLHAERHQDSDDYQGFLRRQQSNDNMLITNQLLSSWQLNGKTDLQAGIAYNHMQGAEPDRRENYLSKRENNEYVLTGSNRQKRFFSLLQENDFNIKAKARFKLDNRQAMDESNIVVGYDGRWVRDGFNAVEYNFSAVSGRYNLDNLALDQVYNSANYQAGKFTMAQGDENRYQVHKFIQSGYVEAIHTFAKKLSVQAGLRLDYVDMLVDYHVQHVTPGSEQLSRLYWLPSLNAKYNINSKHALRLGLSKSYTLPQSKEIAPYQYVNIGFASQGNPNLKPSDNYNIDLKWDFYLSPAELISVNVFGKHIVNPIGRVDQGNSAGLLTYDNIAATAAVAGVELEVRKNIFGSTQAGQTPTNRLSVGCNASYIYTTLNLDVLNTAQRTSGLEGAAPVIVNGDLSYHFTKNDLALTTAVVANYVSRRIYTLGTRAYNDIMEEDLFSLDVVASCEVNKHWSLKLKAANLLNPAYRLTRNINGEAFVLSEYKKGMDVSLGITWNL